MSSQNGGNQIPSDAASHPSKMGHFKMTVFKSMLLRKVFGPKREEVMGD
jgi:hypothetical protein